MKRLALLAPAALFLVSANPPAAPQKNAEPDGELSSVVAAPAPGSSAAPAPAPKRVAPPPRVAAASGYPPCSRTVTDRCIQGRGSVGHHAVRHAPSRQLAYRRAGERG